VVLTATPGFPVTASSGIPSVTASTRRTTSTAVASSTAASVVASTPTVAASVTAAAVFTDVPPVASTEAAFTEPWAVEASTAEVEALTAAEVAIANAV
jgi:hypothetical protein